MSEHYDFHYQPTGSGAISGQQVLEQTEDAINELGDYVNDNVGGAMDVAQQALETAQTAETNAQTALDTANSFSSAIQSAQQDASTALSTAQTAQNTASNANNTAIQAQQDASNAVTTANNASGQVTTLSGTVTTLGQRVTTAEGNIGQNTSDITALTTRVGTAEGNITTLQNDVSIAQGNASSAMATAGQVKQQAYVFRYSSTTLVASSTNSNALLDNTDNLKVGDKVIDSSGVLFSITAIDTANSTFTIGTALIDLAQDSDVVHKSDAENITGKKTFLGVSINFKSTVGVYGATSGNASMNFYDKNSMLVSYLRQGLYNNGLPYIQFDLYGKDGNNQNIERALTYSWFNNTSEAYFRPETNNFVYLGTSGKGWKGVYATNYYYGSNNVEFSTKFVTTDTAQTISGAKTFSEDIVINNSDTSQSSKRLVIKSSKVNLGDNNSDSWGISFNAGSSYVAAIDSEKSYSSIQGLRFIVRTRDGDNNLISAGYRLRVYTDGSAYLSPSVTDYISLGSNSEKWKDTRTNLINGVEPSSLSLPDLANKIDISSYITDLNNVGNEYTPSVNGWISIRSANATKISILDKVTSVGNASISNTATYLTVMTPVVANRPVYITVICTSLSHAYFIPCQGNV